MKKEATAEFIANRGGIAELVGSKLDNAQYVSMLMRNESEKVGSKVLLGNFSTPAGRRFRLSVNGLPVVTNYKGGSVQSPTELAVFLKESRENELHFDSLAYFEVEGEMVDKRKYIGIFPTIADARLRLTEESEQGEL